MLITGLILAQYRTKNEIPAVDPRLSELPCYKRGNLYNNNNRVTEAGGNDFWESGTVLSASYSERYRNYSAS